MFLLAEELLLLALDNKKGRVPCTVLGVLPFGLAGALLAELLLYNSIQTDGKDRVLVRNTSPVGDDLLDGALTQLHRSREGRGLSYWLAALSYGMDDLESRLLGRLVRKGVLRKQEKRFLGMFPLSTYPTRNSAVKEEICTSLRAAAFGGDRTDVRSLVLLGLAEACSLTAGLFSGEERRQVRKLLKEITSDQALAKLYLDVSCNATSSAAAAAAAG